MGSNSSITKAGIDGWGQKTHSRNAYKHNTEAERERQSDRNRDRVIEREIGTE